MKSTVFYCRIRFSIFDELPTPSLYSSDWSLGACSLEYTGIIILYRSHTLKVDRQSIECFRACISERLILGLVMDSQFMDYSFAAIDLFLLLLFVGFYTSPACCFVLRLLPVILYSHSTLGKLCSSIAALLYASIELGIWYTPRSRQYFVRIC